MAVTLVDITSGQLQKVLAYLEAEARYLATPPELRSIFPPNFAFDFSRIRVSVQLSQERLRYAEARQRERERAAGVWPDADQQRYARRSAEEYAAQAQRAVVQDWEQVRGAFHTRQWLRWAIILGDPGFGKSWLLRYEGHALARAEIARLQRSEVGTASVVLPIFARLGELAAQKGSLLDRLRAVLQKTERGVPHVAEVEFWNLIAAKAQDGQALLLLDGWDEVRQGRAQLQEALETFVRTNPQCRMYLTSRIAGYVPLNLSAREWELVLFSPRQIQVFVQNFFSMPASLQDEPQGDYESQATRGAALWRALRQRPQVMGLARIPLMLVLLCRLAWEGQALPDRRVEVYKQCLEGLLWRWRKEVDDDTILATDRIEEKLRLLPILAFELFQMSPQLDVWPWLDLRTRLQQLPGGPSDREKAAALIAELMRDGILVREGESDRAPFRFLHLTFQEYLAASALTQRHDWRQTVTRWLEGFWEPRAPVIELLAGMLPDATPLIELLLAYDDPRPLQAIAPEWLMQPQRGPNPFGNVLLLAARCGAETRKIARASMQDLCRRAEQRQEDELQKNRVVQALAWLGRQQTEPFARLVAALHDKGFSSRRAVAQALGQLGDARTLEPLLTALHDWEFWVRKAAAQALERIERQMWEEKDRLP